MERGIFPVWEHKSWSGEGSGKGTLNACCTFSEEKKAVGQSHSLKTNKQTKKHNPLWFNPKSTCGWNSSLVIYY